MTIVWYLLVILVGYLCGCSSMSYYISKIKHIDIKGNGSRNYGASNTAMLAGLKSGILVFVHDTLKSALPIIAVRLLLPEMVYADVIIGFAAIIGHIFPFYLKFNGGKGYASYIGMAIALHPLFSLIAFLLSVGIALMSDLVVASTFTMLLALPLYCFVTGDYIQAIIILCVSILITIKHKENIKNIVTKNGKEASIKATIFKKKRSDGNE